MDSLKIKLKENLFYGKETIFMFANLKYDLSNYI